MKTEKCKYHGMLPDYIDQTLSESDEQTFLEHLQGCQDCSGIVQQMQSVEKILLSTTRPDPNVDILYAYQTKLDKRFPVRNRLQLWLAGVTQSWNKIRLGYPRVVAFSRAAAFIITGIIIGRMFFYSPMPLSFVDNESPNFIIIAPAEQDYQLINAYVERSEILLLAIKNTNGGRSKQADELLPEKQLASDLLSSFPKIQDNYLVLQDDELNNFLNKLELVLLEVSNSDEQDIVLVFREMKKVIDKTRLVTETRKIQQKIEKMI